MHPVRDFFAELSENWSRGINGFLQMAGILPDGRELVQESEEKSGTVIELPDRSEEGWPGFSCCIPGQSRFDRAHNSILGRRAQWVIPMPHEAVVRHLIEQNPDFPAPADDLKREFTPSYRGEALETIVGVGFRLDGGVELSVVGVQPEISIIGIRQRRSHEALEEAMRARYRTLGRIWGRDRSEP